MTEPRRPIANLDLEAALKRLAQHIEYPPTPDLATAVRAQVETASAPRSRLQMAFVTTRWRLAAAAAIVLVVLATAILGLSSGARSAVADLLGLRGARIQLVPALPSLTPRPTVAPALPSAAPPAESSLTGTGKPAAGSRTDLPTPTAGAGAQLQLGRRVTLVEAQAIVPYPIMRPSLPYLGEPDEIYLARLPVDMVSFIYLPRAGLPADAQTGVGLLLTQFDGRVQADFFGKLLGPGTRLEPVTVNGGRGWWIEGAAHGFFFIDRNGTTQQESLRLAGNTLLWEQGGLLLRLEGTISREEALRIAVSIR